MAESSSGEGSWWGSWVQAAKEKSAQTYELIKADLSEFRNVCSQDASVVVASTTETLQGTLQHAGEHSKYGEAGEKVKRGLTTLLGGITKVLTVPHDDDDNDEMLKVTPSGNFEVFDKAKARLYEIQTSPQTYCTEPDDLARFDDWVSSFDLESKKGEISELLISVTEVRSIYTKLVPSAVSHSDFWQRYFYKVYQLEQDEKRKADLKKRADMLKPSTVEWEDDWDDEEAAVQPDFSPSADSGAAITSQESSPTSVKALEVPLPQMDQRPTEMTEPQEIKDPIAMATVMAPSSVTDKPANTATTPVKSATMTPDSSTEVKPTETDSKKMNEAESPVTSTEQPLAVTVSGKQEVGPETNGQLEADKSAEEIKVKEKGGYIMVGSERPTPTSSIGSENKEVADADWEDDELTGEELKEVAELASKLDLKDADLEDDWDSWE